MREHRSRRRGLVEREPILLVLENVLDRAIAVGAQAFGARTGGIEPIRAIEATQPHEAEARAIALLRMRAPVEDARDEPACRGTRLVGPRDQPRGRPFGVGAMRPRHVRDVGRVATTTGETRVRGDAPPAHEDFDRGRRDARLNARVDELIRHAVPVVVDLDVNRTGFLGGLIP